MLKGKLFSTGAGVSVGATLSSTYSFDPNTTDAGQNAMKLYVDLGNVLSGLPGPANALYNFVDATIAPSFLGSNLTDVEADVQAGLYANATFDVGLPLGQQAEVGVEGSFSASADAIYGYEEALGCPNESASVKGLAASVTADLAAQAGFTSFGGGATNKLAYSLFSVGLAVQQTEKEWTRRGQNAWYRSETIHETSCQRGWQIPVATWQRYDPGSLFGSYARDFTETIQTTNGSPLAGYFWSVYAGQSSELNYDLDLGVADVSLQGELDQGAEVINERGAISQSRSWPTESYPAVTTDLLPTLSWFTVLSQWGNYASGPIWQAVSHTFATIANTANNIVQAGEKDLSATLTFGQDVMAGGSQVVSSWVPGLAGSGVHPNDKSPPTIFGPLPPLGASNYIYGLSGIYRFASSNSFNGTGTVAIAYSAAQAAGLYEAEFRVYRLDDNTNRWALIGGTVDMVSNLVTAAITNLGTYAVAPPLPTGYLWLQPSANSLSADGVSQMTVVVTNLLLNTGGSATQAWLFTASAVGVDILSSDADTNRPGVQMVSTNATLTLQLRAPAGGTYANVR